MKKLIDLIKKGKIVVFSGAGLSTESGIPAFRGKGGLWEKYDPDIYATVDGIRNLFRNNIEDLKNFIVDCYSVFLKAKPNYAHYILKELEDKGYIIGIITQNIDDFHLQAGSKNVAQLHGNAYIFICSKCKYSIRRQREEIEEFIKKMHNSKSKIAIKKNILQLMARCPYCKGRLRSSIVFFGEEVISEELHKSYVFLNEANSVLCVGTSGVVYPAAYLPFYAHSRGVKIISVNLEYSSFDEIAEFVVKSKAIEFFKNLSFYL